MQDIYEYDYNWLYQWFEANLIETQGKLKKASLDRRWWIPQFIKKQRVASLKNRLTDIRQSLDEIVVTARQIEEIKQAIEAEQAQIDNLQYNIGQKEEQIKQLHRILLETIMGRKKKQGAVKREGVDASTGQGLSKVLTILILMVVVGLFLYWSPFFNKETISRPSPELNRPAEVSALPNHDANKSQDYDFYNVLPDRKIETANTNLSEQQEEVLDDTLQVDRVEDNSQSDEITVVETDETYDEPSDNEVKVSSAGVEYFLKIQTFDNPADADKRRSEVLMAGIDADIRILEAENGTTIYEVVSTPLANQELAKSAHARLKENHIDALVVEKKH